MSNHPLHPAIPAPVAEAPGRDPDAETQLGMALAAIHRALAHLDDPDRAEFVAGALERAAGALESARHAHGALATARATSGVEAEIVAVIAAAVAILVRGPHRVLAVQPAAAPSSWGNAWAMEGRFEHYSSHKVR